MDSSGAEKAVTTSALIVAGVYGYRRLTEGSTSSPATLKSVAGIGKPPPPLGAWATAWGFTFLVVALIAEASPELGGSFAILIAAADLLTNTSNVIADVGKAEKGAGTATANQSPAQTGAGLTAIAGAASTPAAQAGVAAVAGSTTTGAVELGSAALGF